MWTNVPDMTQQVGLLSAVAVASLRQLVTCLVYGLMTASLADTTIVVVPMVVCSPICVRCKVLSPPGTQTADRCCESAAEHSELQHTCLLMLESAQPALSLLADLLLDVDSAPAVGSLRPELATTAFTAVIKLLRQVRMLTVLWLVMNMHSLTA